MKGYNLQSVCDPQTQMVYKQMRMLANEKKRVGRIVGHTTKNKNKTKVYHIFNPEQYNILITDLN